MFSAAEILEEFVSAAEAAPIPTERFLESLSFRRRDEWQKRTHHLECARCGETFEAPTAGRAGVNPRRRFCSRRCQNQNSRWKPRPPRTHALCLCGCGRSLEGKRADAKWFSPLCQATAFYRARKAA